MPCGRRRAANAPDFNGIAQVFSSPLQTIRDDFGTARLDRIFSGKDSSSAVYTIDDSDDFTATTADPYSTDVESLREQVLSLDETHIFSPQIAQYGPSRLLTGELLLHRRTHARHASRQAFQDSSAAIPWARSWSEEAPPRTPRPPLVLPGAITAATSPFIGIFLHYDDHVDLTRGRHRLNLGVWFQRVQSNEELALSQFGQATFASLATFLQGTTSSFLYTPQPTEMNWRSWLGAWYAEDVIRVTPTLTLSLGFRDEFTNGWNEAHGRASTYTFTGAVVSANPTVGTGGMISTQPTVGNSVFTVNNAKFLPQPRIGLAWSPSRNKTVVRAAFGMYNDLQDALGYRTDQNAPFNTAYSIANFTVSQFPVSPSAAVPAAAKIVPGGVQPNLKTPTLISYSVRIEQQLAKDTTFTLGYVGSHGYHEILGIDANTPAPVICPAAPCPATYPTAPPAAITAGFPAGSPLAGAPVPAGKLLCSNHNQSQPRAGQYMDVVLGGGQLLQLPPTGCQSPLQRRIVTAGGLYLVKGSRRWGFAELYDFGGRARARVQSLQSPGGLGTGEFRCPQRERYRRDVRFTDRTWEPLLG